MIFAFKVTTNGRAVIAACMALEAPPVITRVAVGSGRVPEDVDLADVHQLIHYEAEGAVGDRRHEDNRLFLTVQYSNTASPVGHTFLLSEFIVYARNPATGAETDLIYATLGDYCQSVPPASPDFPAAVWNFPMTLVLSDEIDVAVSAPAGLVTYDDLVAVLNGVAVRRLDLVIPKDGWTNCSDGGPYPVRLRIPLEVTARSIPQVTVLPESSEAASDCGLAPFAQTEDGVLTLWAESVPETALHASLALFKDSTGVYMSELGGLLPVATADRVGGVKVGSGLVVAEDGTLSVDAASPQEVREMLEEVLDS